MSNVSEPTEPSGLSEYKHMDPEKHLIGETLAAPSQIINTGSTASVGISPIAAREDHYHGGSAWTSVTGGVGFTNGWTDYDAPRPAQYRKVGDDVQLRGVIENGTVGLSAFPLPVGYRPYQSNESYAVNSNAAFGTVTIDSSGNVVPSSPSSNIYVFLSGIRFSTIA